MAENQFNQAYFIISQGEWPKSTMTNKISKSERGVKFSKRLCSGTLGGTLKFLVSGPSVPVLGSEESHKSEPLRSGEALGA